MINETYKHSELTSKIIGCAMKVHSALGNGFQELIYQRALELDLTKNNIAFRSKVSDQFWLYKNGKLSWVFNRNIYVDLDGNTEDDFIDGLKAAFDGLDLSSSKILISTLQRLGVSNENGLRILQEQNFQSIFKLK